MNEPRTIVALLLFAVAGCGGPTLSARMRVVGPQPPPAPDSANVTVVFLMPSSGVAANAVIDETGRALGELPPQSKLVVSVPPGPHTFIQAMYKNPGNGDFSLWGHIMCNPIGGVLEAGKIYFAELSVFRVFAVKAGDARLAAWAAAPVSELDPAKGPASVSADPEWGKCVTQARENADKARRKQDVRSIFEAGDGRTSWPQ